MCILPPKITEKLLSSDVVLILKENLKQKILLRYAYSTTVLIVHPMLLNIHHFLLCRTDLRCKLMLITAGQLYSYRS